MKQLKYLLFPFSFLYWIVTTVRNSLFNNGILKSFEIPGKSIVVGNLSVGGTGKSPHVDYIIQHFLKDKMKITTLSRGYGRNTKGFILASENSSSNEIGDEPLMFKSRHGENINVAVCEDRTEGVKEIQDQFPNNELIILDDAFQHRKVKAGLNIIISDFNNPFYSDYLLPLGRLREPRKGISRADALIISKCPNESTERTKKDIANSCRISSEKVFFSTIKYSALKPICEQPLPEIENIILVTGIANPTPLLNNLSDNFNVTHLSFKDHHEFSEEDIDKIHKKFDTFASQRKAIITTEKDYMRLKKFNSIFLNEYQWFYQPIEVSIDRQNEFNTLINNYVREV